MHILFDKDRKEGVRHVVNACLGHPERKGVRTWTVREHPACEQDGSLFSLQHGGGEDFDGKKSTCYSHTNIEFKGLECGSAQHSANSRVIVQDINCGKACPKFSHLLHIPCVQGIGFRFNALIYMHRYQPHTVSRVLSHYVRDYREKLSEKVKLFAATQANGENITATAQKKDMRYKNIIAELQKWEDDVLYPLSTQRLSIDLDDGVKVNYLKFGTALKKILGLADKDES